MTGDITNAGPGRDVTHVRFAPSGAHTSSENRGSAPWPTAYAIHRIDQM